MRPFARFHPFAPHARCGWCESKSATHLWTNVVRLGVPRVGPAFPAVRCVEPGFAHETLSREIHVSAPKRAAADVTRPRGPLPRTARLIGTSRRDRRGRLRRGGPHRRTTAQPDLPTWIFMSSTYRERKPSEWVLSRLRFIRFSPVCVRHFWVSFTLLIMGMFGTSHIFSTESRSFYEKFSFYQ